MTIDWTTEWVRFDTGPVSLLAPRTRPRQISGAHGHLWQWVGDGRPLLALTLATRETRVGTAFGVEGHLGSEIKQVVGGLDEPSRAEVDRDVFVLVEGASSVMGAVVVGARHGRALREAVVVSTDGSHLFSVRVGVVDQEDGREVVSRVLDDVRLKPWDGPR